jgi:hypothetical protein
LMGIAVLGALWAPGQRKLPDLNPKSSNGLRGCIPWHMRPNATPRGPTPVWPGCSNWSGSISSASRRLYWQRLSRWRSTGHSLPPGTPGRRCCRYSCPAAPPCPTGATGGPWDPRSHDEGGILPGRIPCVHQTSSGLVGGRNPLLCLRSLHCRLVRPTKHAKAAEAEHGGPLGQHP